MLDGIVKYKSFPRLPGVNGICNAQTADTGYQLWCRTAIVTGQRLWNDQTQVTTQHIKCVANMRADMGVGGQGRESRRNQPWDGFN